MGRLERPARKRFKSTGLILRGYSRKEVDSFLVRVSSHIDTRTALSLDDVRKVIFTPKRGGYAENQVDAFIDAVIELLQIEKASERPNRSGAGCRFAAFWLGHGQQSARWATIFFLAGNSFVAIGEVASQRPCTTDRLFSIAVLRWLGQHRVV